RILSSGKWIYIRTPLTGTVQVDPTYQIDQGIDQRRKGIYVLTEQAYLLSVVGFGHIVQWLLNVLEGQNGNNGTKLLLFIDPHILGYGKEHCGPNIIVGAFPALWVQYGRSLIQGII